jgi:hypothetical protein
MPFERRWERSMASEATLKLNVTWARAANVTSRHVRDSFVEALREHQQREKDAKEEGASGKSSERKGK